jgi:hypothetical protein
MRSKGLIRKEQEKARKRPDSHNQLDYLYAERVRPVVPMRLFSISKSKLKEFGIALNAPVSEYKLEIECLCENFVNDGAFEQFRINRRHLASYAHLLENACKALVPLLKDGKESFDGYLRVRDVLLDNSRAARLRVHRNEVFKLPDTLQTFAADVGRIARDHAPTKNKAGGQEDRAFKEFMMGLRLIAYWVDADTQLPGKGGTKPDSSTPLRNFAKAVLEFATERGIEGLKDSGLPLETHEKVKQCLNRYRAREVTGALRPAQ